MLYEKLNSTMQETVDEFAERAKGLGWRRRGDLLGQAASSLGEELDVGDEQGRLAARGFLTAVLERLDDGAPVIDPFQASLFRLSLHPEHRERAEEYLAANPEVGKVIEEEIQ